MRNLLAMFALLLGGPFAVGQGDAAAQAMQAAQQAAQQSQQAATDAMRQASEAAQQSSQAMQQSMQASQDALNAPAVCCSFAAAPKFSVKPGKYSAPTTVRITDATRGAIIYYSMDGWTPTTASARYIGPITISSTTTLRAIAVVPGLGRSIVVTAEYAVVPANGAQGQAVQIAKAWTVSPIPTPDGKLILAQDTPVPLVFVSEVSSKTAQVGDPITFSVADDLKMGNEIVVKKGTLASGRVIQVDRTGPGGAPGVVAFQVETLNDNGALIKLYGDAAREGDAKLPSAEVLIPFVGPFTAFRHGTDAVIKAGEAFTGYLAADTTFTASVE
jgi:hypothetical protein